MNPQNAIFQEKWKAGILTNKTRTSFRNAVPSSLVTFSLSLSLPLSPRQGDIWCAPLWPSNVRKSGPSDTAKRLGCTPKSCMAFSTKTSISGTWSLDTARWTNKTWDVIIVPMKYVAMMRNDQIMGISNNMEKSWNTTIPIGYAVCPI